MLRKIRRELRRLADPKRVEASLWFFKTGPGEYGKGDKFLGLTAGQIQNLAKRYESVDFAILDQLLLSPIHEERMLALKILLRRPVGQQIYQFYFAHTKRINNWDLVDVSAPRIVGAYLLDKSRAPLYQLARSKNLWERRIAIISTFAFIRAGEFTDSLKIAEILLHDKHDLIHKAVGWTLREVGKRSRAAEEKFLRKHYRVMPRTMLRYAIEKFPPTRRRFYLTK